jgi:acetyl-CoA synthetase (ADP-forming)
MELIEKAIREGRKLLSEHESYQVLEAYQIPVAETVLVESYEELTKVVEEVGYPIAMKGCSPGLAHKWETGLVRLDIRNKAEALTVYEEIMSGLTGDVKGILVQQMVNGARELVIGLNRDLQFGPCVMFGLGGIHTEILRDVSFRLAPLDKKDALQMTREIKGHKILGPVRGMPPVDLDLLVEMLINVGWIGIEQEYVKEIDLNPVIISDTKPIAVDALITLEEGLL